MKRVLFLLIAVTSVFQACKKDEDQHPEVQTVMIEPLSATRAVLKGNIVNTGSFQVTDYGFVYSTSTIALTESSGTKVSMGSQVSEGMFSKEVSNIGYLGSGRKIYARAYLTNNNGTIFGEIVSADLPSVNTSGISPSIGKAGDLVTINGQFTSLQKEDISVSFGGTSAEITEVTATKVVCKVPVIYLQNSSSGNISVNISIGGQQVYNSYSFKFLPTFKSFTPGSAAIGSSISITADNFNYNYYYYNSVRVYFGTTLASISNSGSNTLIVTVPNVSTVKSNIAVEIDGIRTEVPGEFTALAPVITSISPSSGLPASTFSVFGSNFPTSFSSSNSVVTIGNIPAYASPVSTGQINVTIPNNLPAGNYKVAVKAGPFNVESSQDLVVKSLAISSFSPTSGTSGKEITINGTFVAGQSYDVYFGAAYASGFSATGTSLRAYVPSNANPGAVKISVRGGGQVAESADNFTILAPTITSFSPSSAVAGAVVTINGTGFSTAGWNTVKFGTTTAPVLTTSESTLTVSVPSGLSGAMKISVQVNNGQTAVSSGNFTAQ